jgi:hypothetical protein
MRPSPAATGMGDAAASAAASVRAAASQAGVKVAATAAPPTIPVQLPSNRRPIKRLTRTAQRASLCGTGDHSTRSGLEQEVPGATPGPPGVITLAQPGGPKVGGFHAIPCEFNRKWVEILCNREAKRAGRPLLAALG